MYIYNYFIILLGICVFYDLNFELSMICNIEK